MEFKYHTSQVCTQDLELPHYFEYDSELESNIVSGECLGVITKTEILTIDIVIHFGFTQYIIRIKKHKGNIEEKHLLRESSKKIFDSALKDANEFINKFINHNNDHYESRG